MTSDPDRDIWYLPRMRWYHWLTVVILNTFLTGFYSIAGLIGTAVGTLLLFYALLIVWSGGRHLVSSGSAG